jgi:hypothetical protein
MEWVTKFFPETVASRDEVAALMLDVYSIGSSVFGAAKAREWAGNFTIPTHAVKNDAADFAAHNYDFRSMVDARRQALSRRRLNEARIKKCISRKNPERERLLLLARGMPLLQSEEFKGCSMDDRPRLSRSFTDASGAVEKMFFQDFWSEGLAIILSEEDARR